MKVSLLLIVFSTFAVAQSGGGYDFRHAVIAGGGGTASTGGTYVVGGTIGQAMAGTTSSGGTFSLTGGFWAPEPLAPTAASVDVRGRVVTRDGRGIGGALVTIAGSNGTSRSVVTGTFGSYRIDGVQVGASYVITVSSRRYTFSQPSIFISVEDSLSDINFVAN